MFVASATMIAATASCYTAIIQPLFRPEPRFQFMDERKTEDEAIAEDHRLQEQRDVV